MPLALDARDHDRAVGGQGCGQASEHLGHDELRDRGGHVLLGHGDAVALPETPNRVQRLLDHVHVDVHRRMFLQGKKGHVDRGRAVAAEDGLQEGVSSRGQRASGGCQSTRLVQRAGPATFFDDGAHERGVGREQTRGQGVLNLPQVLLQEGGLDPAGLPVPRSERSNRDDDRGTPP